MSLANFSSQNERAIMDPAAGLTIYNLPPTPPKWDRIGVFFISFCATWTTFVIAGMVFCWINRRNPILKLRGLPLSFGAIILLHTYWIIAQIVYPIGGTMPIVIACDVQYFVMGTYFPLGVALFLASNCRFYHVAKLQKQFAHPDLQQRVGCNGADTSWLCRIRNMYFSARLIIIIAVGMVFQIILTLGMWMACRKYHPTFGLAGTEIRGSNLMEQIVDLGRGWEWWPSVSWLLIWTWIVAPFLIWRAWGIRDTLGWRTQTIGCCLSSLHAIPMFLIASYVPAFGAINLYFPPSQWIHLSTMMFEIFTIFVPLVQVIRQSILTKRAAAINAKWETESQSSLQPSSSTCWQTSASVSINEKGSSLDFLDEELGDRLLTMGALDHVLGENPGPLQEFSALSDFSGENIAFLTRASAWKAFWLAEPSESQRLKAFNGAIEIYAGFISPRDAEFPLNLSSHDLKRLEEIFEAPTRSCYGEARGNTATPFALDVATADESGPDGDSRQRAGLYNGEVPDGFNAIIFDAAFSHIKYLVLTNTWPKFVAHVQSRRRSSETARSVLTADSQKTIASRVLERVNFLFKSS
ncbi:hypothetical protein HIM_06279 [Hirsutella minnesotensis 3608]|uniref:RGS domain-containing protein n=1 Tax=Hirsutella minnesotensis 3608 TaxID=1043627 RepID=A0A0F7ZU55_9HYPO|nr:hypothetical protein HIM_06279 [Hirsutella minnesotensis 3608]